MTAACRTPREGQIQPRHADPDPFLRNPLETGNAPADRPGRFTQSQATRTGVKAVASDREAPHGAWPLVAAIFGTRGLRRPDTSNSVAGGETPCPVGISDRKTS
ncbi:hypothetical protein GCM10009743_24320 [Kribbella swartbergensis]